MTNGSIMSTETNAQTRSFNVVAIGGGTGLSTLLKGLKRHVRITPALAATPEPPPPALSPQIENLTAIVTVTDDGGSSGRLRREFKILPPGDIRNCMRSEEHTSELQSHSLISY